MKETFFEPESAPTDVAPPPVQAKDRSALLRMAGNIAAGMAHNTSGHAYDLNALQAHRIAKSSVAIARAILAEVDR